jgi:hypothetical protein
MKDQSSKEDTDPSEIVATNGPITLAISTTLHCQKRVIASYHTLSIV